MEHPSKDVIYFLSYPRSGSSWFRYCFSFITNTKMDNPELLFHTHWQTDKEFKIENCFDIKNILILRNYKEAIFSELSNMYLTNAINGPIGKVLEYASNMDGNLEYDHPPIDPRLSKFPEITLEIPEEEGPPTTEREIADYCDQFALNCNVKKNFNDFLLDYKEQSSLNLNLDEHGWEYVCSTSVGSHYHFALQLKRYYDLLEYHDKVSKTNPNNALIIKYENFMENPFFELNRAIDFMKESSLVTSEDVGDLKNNLRILIENIEYHKIASINKYKISGHLPLSYKKDNKYNFHSSKCRKEFLVEIDNILKNKNLELFNKYLSDYEEKGD